MITLINAKKASDKTLYPFMIKKKKKLKQLVRERNYLKIIKIIYEKPIANITLNGERLKAPPLRAGTWQVCLLSPLLLNIVLEVLAREINKKK